MEKQKKESENIFDMAAKLSKKEKEAKKEEAPGVSKPPVLSQEELAERFAQYKKQYEQVADTINSMLAKKNLSLEKLQEYFNTPSNFNDENWKMIQSQKKIIEAKLQELSKRKEAEKKEEEKGGKKGEHKPKTIPSRSRWMPMR
jgi:hypothetical protein